MNKLVSLELCVSSLQKRASRIICMSSKTRTLTTESTWNPRVRLDSSVAEPHSVAADLHSLARIMWSNGRTEEAVPYQEQALRIKKQRGDEDIDDFVEDLESLKRGEPYPYASTASTVSDDAPAQSWTPSVRLGSSVADPHVVAADLHSLARVMWHAGRHQEALPYQAQAIKIKEMRGDEDIEEFRSDLEALRNGEPCPY